MADEFSQSIHLLSSPFIFEDITSFNFLEKVGDMSGTIYSWFIEPTEVIKYRYNSNGVVAYTTEINDSPETYLLINGNYDNYLYRQYNGKSSNKETKLKSIYFKTNQDLVLFYLDESLINTEETYEKLKTYQISIDNIQGSNKPSISYKANILEESFGDSQLSYSENSSDEKIFFYINFNAELGMSNSFNIDDYIYELRINGIPTKFFEVSKATRSLNNNLSATSIYNLKIKIDAESFKTVNKLDDLNYFIFTIKNKFINEHKSFYYSRFEDNIKPFISYDPMTQTTSDININCRFDLSLLTTDQTNDVVVDINNDKLLTTINDRRKPVVDNNIIFDFTGDPNINIMALGKSIVKMTYNTSNESDEMYIISQKDLNFENKDYKVTCKNGHLIEGTNSYMLCNREGYNELYFQVESTTDIKSKIAYYFSVRLFKLNQEQYKKDYNLKANDTIDIDTLGKKLLWTHKKNVITINFKVTINASKKYEFTQDEQSILKDILSFQNDIISTTFGDSTLFSIKANDNIILNDSDLNSDKLKEYVANGGRDLTYIDNNNSSFDIKFYGIYIDHMIIDNPEIGEIYINRINNATLDTTDEEINIIEQRLVCNASENEYDSSDGKDYTDDCKDGFNKKAFIQEVDGKNKRILIVPEDAYNLFNFLNSKGHSGCYSLQSVTEEIDTLPSSDYVDTYFTGSNSNESSFALYPYADLTFRANDNDELSFNKANLYIDYYPVIHRLTKENKDTIVWTIYTGSKITNLKVEKIMKLVVSEKSQTEEDESIINDEIGAIYDSNSTITYPSFVTFKILMETEGHDPSAIDSAEYIGKITNVSELPVVIKDISLENFSENSELFKLNTDKTSLDDNSFMKYEISGNNNYIKTDSLVIANYANHSDLTTLEGDIFILKPGGTLDVKIYNNDSLSSIPEEFGMKIGKLTDSLHYELYYVQDNIDDDKNDIKYTFRENGNTESTNMETVIDVYPLISSLNFDTDYYRYGETILNPITKDIIDRSVLFRLIPKSNDEYNLSNYRDLIDDVIDGKELSEDILYYYDGNLQILDLDNIYFLESGKTYSYVDIINKLKTKYFSDDNLDILNTINTAKGIQVITKTTYNNGDTQYDMVIINNYLDLYSNADNFLPKLNRLTGSLYHLLTIENKHEDLYEYKIVVDDKEYQEGDLVYNKYANEIALHKFRLYYKPKFKLNNSDNKSNRIGEILINSNSEYNGFKFGDIDGDGIISYNDYKLLKEYVNDSNSVIIIQELADLNSDGIIDGKDLELLENYLKNCINIGKPVVIDKDEEGNDIVRFVGNFYFYFNEKGEEQEYTEKYDCIAEDKFTNTDKNLTKKIYLECNEQKKFFSKDQGHKVIAIEEAGFSDLRCLEEYVEYLKNHPTTKPSQIALLLGDLNNDGIIDEKDIEILEFYIKNYGYLVGDIDENGIVDSRDASGILYGLRVMKENNISSFNILLANHDFSNYSKNIRVWDVDGDGIISGGEKDDNYNYIYYQYNYNSEEDKVFNNAELTDAGSILKYSALLGSDDLYKYENTKGNKNYSRVGKYILEVPFTLNDEPIFNNDSEEWILADSFEGCIDGTKPLVPNLITKESTINKSFDMTPEENNKCSQLLHKYSVLTRDELKEILYDPGNVLNEVNLYKDVNIITNISYNMTYEITGTAGISKLRVPDREINEETNENTYKVLASNLVKGKFQIVNTTTECLNVEINQRIIDGESKYPFTITTDAPLSHTTMVMDYQPIFRIDPNGILNVYVQFDKNISGYETLLDIRVQNNYNKKYTDENIKWDNYTVKLVNEQNYSFNSELILKLLPYSFYTDIINEENKITRYEYADYYDIKGANNQEDPDKIFNVLNINNFNRSSLYSTYIYFDNTLIYDSSIGNTESEYKLLIPKKILDRKMYIGDHTLTVITNKFNGLLNYQNYYITLIDHNIYKDGDIYRNYFKDRIIENYDEINEHRKSIIPRHPRNEGYNSKEFVNELFLDTSGDVSMVTRDYSKKNESYYLYKFTEIIQHYMCLSDFIVDSDQYLFEKNYQEVLHYYDICKNEYDSYMKDIYGKLNKSSGEIYRYINNIEYFFDEFDIILNSITEELNKKEEKQPDKNSNTNYYDDDTKFISKLFYNDQLLFRYKEFNALYSLDSLTSNNYTIQIDLIKEINKLSDKNLYIYDEGNDNFGIDKVIIVPMDVMKSDSQETSEVVVFDSIEGISSMNSKLHIDIFKILADKQLEKIKDRNLCMLIAISINNESYYFKVNLYNIENTLKLDNKNDIKFSYKDRIERTLINTSNMTITFQITDRSNGTDNIISLNGNTNINDTTHLNTKIITSGNINNNEITLPPYMSCKIIFSCEVDNIDTKLNNLSKKARVYYEPTNNEEPLSNYNIVTDMNNGGSGIISKSITFKITNIDISKTDTIYKYIHNTNESGSQIIWPSYSKNLLYISIPTIFLSDFEKTNIKRLNIKNYSEDNSFFIIVNDVLNSNYKYGHFSVVNGKNITPETLGNNIVIKDYLPFRKNKIQPNYYIKTNDENVVLDGNTYDDCYYIQNIRQLINLDNEINFEENNFFPIIVSRKNNSFDPCYSITINEGNLNDDIRIRTFNGLNITYNQSISTNSDYLKFIKLNTLNYVGYDDAIFEGAIVDNNVEMGAINFYGTYINNTSEYIVNYLNNYKIDDSKSKVCYIYPTTETNSTNSNIELGAVSDTLKYGDLIFNDIDDSLINEDNFFKYSILRTTLFEALNSPEDSQNNKETYSSIIYKLNYLENDNFEGIFNNLRNKIREVYKIKSKIATLKQNIVIQEEQLKEKATVKEFKEWINENVFALAEFEYIISEIYSDFYYLSNKGMSNLNFTKYMDNGINVETSEIVLDTSNSYPIINRYRRANEQTTKYIFDALNLQQGETYISPNIWKSERENVNITSTDNYNKGEHFFNKKFWLDLLIDTSNNTEKINPVILKRNFIDTSNLIHTRFNISNIDKTIHYYKN